MKKHSYCFWSVVRAPPAQQRSPDHALISLLLIFCVPLPSLYHDSLAVPDRKYFLVAGSQEQRDRWITSLRLVKNCHWPCLVFSPVRSILTTASNLSNFFSVCVCLPLSPLSHREVCRQPRRKLGEGRAISAPTRVSFESDANGSDADGGSTRFRHATAPASAGLSRPPVTPPHASAPG